VEPVSGRPGRVKPVSVRPTETELERWRANAAYFPKLSFSQWLRRSISEVCDVAEANRRNEAEDDRRAARLGRLDPTVVRDGDLGNRDDWPVDGPPYGDAA
jgi:hypothetical protein